jgi:hypothetical protein
VLGQISQACDRGIPTDAGRRLATESDVKGHDSSARSLNKVADSAENLPGTVGCMNVPIPNLQALEEAMETHFQRSKHTDRSNKVSLCSRGIGKVVKMNGPINAVKSVVQRELFEHSCRSQEVAASQLWDGHCTPG